MRSGRSADRRTGRILVVGGYGKVGAEIAARLATRHPGRVCVGGRDGARAASAARVIGNGAVGRAIDLSSPRARLMGVTEPAGPPYSVGRTPKEIFP